jgi:hypothetical protein
MCAGSTPDGHCVPYTARLLGTKQTSLWNALKADQTKWMKDMAFSVTWVTACVTHACQALAAGDPCNPGCPSHGAAGHPGH